MDRAVLRVAVARAHDETVVTVAGELDVVLRPPAS
jgi:hypothetical protein